MTPRARSFLLLFVAVALAAILPPLFCLVPARAAKPPAVFGWSSAEVEEARPAPALRIVGGSPAVYVTHPIGIAWAPSPTPVFYAHTADELVIGCACDRCQQFVRRNP